jgi:hypothetical protein
VDKCPFAPVNVLELCFFISVLSISGTISIEEISAIRFDVPQTISVNDPLLGNLI